MCVHDVKYTTTLHDVPIIVLYVCNSADRVMPFSEDSPRYTGWNSRLLMAGVLTTWGRTMLLFSSLKKSK